LGFHLGGGGVVGGGVVGVVGGDGVVGGGVGGGVVGGVVGVGALPDPFFKKNLPPRQPFFGQFLLKILSKCDKIFSGLVL